MKNKEKKVCPGKYTNTGQGKKNKKKYRKLQRAQTRNGLAGNLANLGISKGSKAINSILGKKIIDKGIENISSLFRYGASKIKNKNVHRALNPDIANYVVEETQNKGKNKRTNLSGGV